MYALPYLQDSDFCRETKAAAIFFDLGMVFSIFSSFEDIILPVVVDVKTNT